MRVSELAELKHGIEKQLQVEGGYLGLSEVSSARECHKHRHTECQCVVALCDPMRHTHTYTHTHTHTHTHTQSLNPQ
jgi:hypothetical protein